MERIKYLFFLIPFFFIACNQETSNTVPAAKISKQEKTPLEEQIEKVQNTVLLEPLGFLENNPYFYNAKQTLSRALENSSQKEIFYSCQEFEKQLRMTLQTEYSSDFPSASWQRNEIEAFAKDIAKNQCADIYTLRASFLADLQNAVNTSDTKDEFIQNAKPVVEKYAKDVLQKSNYYLDILHKTLVPYKKLRQIFYPLDQAGYSTYLLEQNDFKNLKQIVLPFLQGKENNINKTAVNNLLTQAQEEEKILFVFLKKYDSLTQINGDCIKQFFPGLKEKWYNFMYEIEKLPSKNRQAYADKRFNQAKDGLAEKCPKLTKKSNKTVPSTPQQSVQNQESYQETQENEEEIYYF